VAGYLIDTNFISETRKIRSDAGVTAFLSASDATGLFLSVLTLGELRRGVEAKRRTDSATSARLSAWVDGIETTFADRILPVEVAAARHWGELSAGRSLPMIDTLIAAHRDNAVESLKPSGAMPSASGRDVEAEI
jgi:predicted nucleic acid-binding protein